VATEPHRIATLDTLRGVAVMGILAMNIVAFAMPRPAYFNPLAYGGSSEDLIAWFVSFVLVDGKMRGFFSFLFGASMLLVIERAEAAGASPASVHYRRMAWLLVIGLCHLYFIWWGDILTLYATIGLIAFAFREQEVRSLVRWAIGLMLVDLLLMTSIATFFSSAEAAANAPGASAQAVAIWQDASRDFAPLTAPALAADLSTYRGGYAGILSHRVEEMLIAPLIGPLIIGWETLAYMLLGMAGLKSGFLTGAWERRRYVRTAALTLSIAVPAYALLGWLTYRSGFHIPTLFALVMAATAPLRLLMIVGYASLVILLTAGGGPLVERIAAAGRAAFTNYLGTSLVMTTLFYGYGLGLYGSLSRLELWLPMLAMWIVMLAWSKPWLDRFRYGPLEWLWRSLARWRIQPMRRPAAG
jgi:uncharacterized protein